MSSLYIFLFFYLLPCYLIVLFLNRFRTMKFILIEFEIYWMVSSVNLCYQWLIYGRFRFLRKGPFECSKATREPNVVALFNCSYYLHRTWWMVFKNPFYNDWWLKFRRCTGKSLVPRVVFSRQGILCMASEYFALPDFGCQAA